ncbi:MAG: SBBP repeat-containing protein [Candidatus Krumholzibacteria bacterium]
MQGRKCLWLMIAFLTVVTYTGQASAESNSWSQRFGGTGADSGYRIAVDLSGNMIITGTFSNATDFGGGPLVSVGSGDVFVAKYAANGRHLWSRRFGGPNLDSGSSVGIDADGNVFVTGCVVGAIDFGGGPLTAAGGVDIFVMKLDANGNYLWSLLFGDVGLDAGYDVAVDTAGDVWLTGFFEGVVDFGGGPLAAAGDTDVFVAKLTAAGNHVTSQRFGGAHKDRAHRIALDRFNNVLVTGQFGGDLDVEGNFLINAGGDDGFLVKFDAQGNHLWSRGFGGPLGDISYGLAVDESGNAFVTGYFRDRVSFDGSTLVSAGALDIFVAKYDSSGTHLWSRRLGGPGGDSGWALAVDADANVVVTGNIQSTADSSSDSLTPDGAADIFFALYDSEGVHLWSQRFGGVHDDFAFDIVTLAPENVAIVGAFEGGVDLGDGELTSAGLSDIFLTILPFNATPVLIRNFSANEIDGRVELNWDVLTEVTVLGFSIRRSSGAHEPVEITGGLLPQWQRDFIDHVSVSGVEYSYTLVVVLQDGSTVQSAPVIVRPTVLVTALLQNLPNPFRLSTLIRFSVSGQYAVDIRVYNAMGKLVRTLVDQPMSYGTYQVEWEGRDNSGRPLASGVYFYQLRAGPAMLTKKTVLLR